MTLQKHPKLSNTYVISTAMLVSMNSKASHAKGTSRVQGHTYNSSVSLCNIRSTDGGCTVILTEDYVRVRVPTSLIFLLLYEDMLGRCADQSAHVRCHSHSIIVRLICHHPHHQFLRNSNVGIAVSFFACAQACTAFTSATNKMKVNCQLGHHFVAQTSSKRIGL